LYSTATPPHYTSRNRSGSVQFSQTPTITTTKSTTTSLIQKRTMADFKPVYTKDAAFPAGPYSQAIATPTTIYCSGQIPCTPAGEIFTLSTSTISQMTELCISNLSAVLVAAGSELGKVVKVNVFLTTMDHFAEMNATYEKFFTHKPARSCVAVKELPKGVPVEIECIALA